MKTWRLTQIGGGNSEARHHCMQIYHSICCSPLPDGRLEIDRRLLTMATYGYFDNKVKEISKQHPRERITVRYHFYDLFDNAEDEAAEITPVNESRIVEYHNGEDKKIEVVEAGPYIDEINELPC
jgi:hypothetical protein